MKEPKDIKTIGDLQEVVYNDLETHRIKNLAELLLIAMTDWPTHGQTKIADFVRELKDFYGDPLTLDKIDNKSIDLTKEHEAWRLEVGSSIAEMFEISARLDNESDFDNILQRLLNYYKK